MTKKIKTVIVDDDKFQLKLVEDFVKKTNFLQLEGSYSDPIVALDTIINTSPDLILLDIEMPELTGLDILKSLPNVPQTVIVTGKEEYAIKAFELDVVDYLLKPIDNYARFLKAMLKVKNNYELTTEQGETTSETFYVREKSIYVRISVKEIQYLEAYGDYVKLGTSEKVYVIHSTLSKIEKRLSDDFIRVHRSYIVQFSEIANIDQNSLQVGEKLIPISLTMKPNLMKRIQTL